jgi:SAM-dependent methyltransferase
MSIRTHAARAVAGLPPAIRFRVRNIVALGRWMLVPNGGELPSVDGYPDTFWDFHGGDDWAGFAEIVQRYCAPRSLVDVGCGDGRLLAAVRAIAGDLDILGIDSSPAALQRAQKAGVPVERHDLSFWRSREPNKLRDRIAGFDVTLSLETAEHLPPWTGPVFVEALTQGRLAIFSAAHPDQGGTLHMNERPFAYWRALFEARGFRVCRFDEEFRAAVRALDLPWWYGENIHVFERAPR